MAPSEIRIQSAVADLVLRATVTAGAAGIWEYIAYRALRTHDWGDSFVVILLGWAILFLPALAAAVALALPGPRFAPLLTNTFALALTTVVLESGLRADVSDSTRRLWMLQGFAALWGGCVVAITLWVLVRRSQTR